MKRQPGKAQDGNADLFALADAVSIVYGQPGAEAATEKLREALAAYQVFLQAKPRGEVLKGVLKLILVCPLLLTRPPGCEWVTDALHKALHNRKYDPAVNKDFWQALQELRADITKGRPANKLRDFFRYQLVQAMMHPVTTAPGQGMVQTQGLSKTEAVEKLAEMEADGAGRSLDAREIWRSLQRAEAYLSGIRTQVEKQEEEQQE